VLNVGAQRAVLLIDDQTDFILNERTLGDARQGQASGAHKEEQLKEIPIGTL